MAIDGSLLVSYVSVMTETTKTSELISPTVERFILKWGDMGGVWGVNRSVAQVHALLYLTPRALTAEEIADALGIARSNVSNSLKELAAWNLVHRVPMRGDRREHFEAEGDIWEIVARIAAGRKQREIDPIISTLASCLEAAETDQSIDKQTKRRLSEMHEFTVAADKWFADMLRLPRGKLKLLMRLGSKVAGLLPSAKRS